MERSQQSTEIKRIIRDYYHQLYTNKMDNVEEMEKFLEKYIFTKLSQEEKTDPSQAWKLKLQSEIFQQTEAQVQKASQLNYTKNLEKS